MNSFQWTLGADFQDTTSIPTAGDTGHKCFCSTYPLSGSTKWPWGVSEQTDTGTYNESEMRNFNADAYSANLCKTDSSYSPIEALFNFIGIVL